MWELRWVLLGLGALFILGVYLWGRGVTPFGRKKRKLRVSEPTPHTIADNRRRVEPPLSADDAAEPAIDVVEPEEEVYVEAAPEPAEAPQPALPDKIVALRFIPRNRELNCGQVVLALRAAGLRHGRYGIFHRLAPDGGDEPLFSVASLTEPGSFDLARLEETTLPGMSFFLLVPGYGDPVERFDDMVETARSLAHDLDAELFDDGGSSWNIQRERYVREELIRYRHELSGRATHQSDRQLDGFL